MAPATVGLAHIAHDPSDPELLALVEQALHPVGGIRSFVGEGDLVVLKPNQTVWFLAREGVTTDPRLVAAMVALCRQAGADRIVVGDSSGGDLRTARVMEVTGVERLAYDAGADEIVGFEDTPQVEVEVHVADRTRRFRVPKVVQDADVVVNLPKIKTHFYDPISCALKNWAGLPHQKERPTLMEDGLIQPAIAALHKMLPAALHVADGLWAGEGTGPVSNDGVWLGCVAASTDPVALDVTAARLLSLDPARVAFVAAARDAGLGEHDPSRISVIGPLVEDVRIAARAATPGFDHLPVRVLQGEGVTWAGSLGHFKSIAETFHKYDLWDPVIALHGRPTFMIGAIEDPRFEEHVEEGPYFVIDDAAHDRYRTDARVTVVPGHPATHNIFPYLFRRLAVPRLGPAAMRLKALMEQGSSWFHDRKWDAVPHERAPPTRES